VKLSRLYRQFGREEIAEPIFRNAVKSGLADDSFEKERRTFFYEWSLAAGHAEDYARFVWLASLSLSDWQQLPPLGTEQVKLSLTGLGAACQGLFAERSDQIFLKAAGAAGQLGLGIKNLNLVH
jgi:hypothetical protein